MNTSQETEDHFGEIYWHEAWKTRIVVVNYEGDKRWWFVPAEPWYGVRVVRATSKLSEMKEYDGRERYEGAVGSTDAETAESAGERDTDGQ